MLRRGRQSLIGIAVTAALWAAIPATIAHADTPPAGDPVVAEQTDYNGEDLFPDFALTETDSPQPRVPARAADRPASGHPRASRSHRRHRRAHRRNAG